MNKEEKLLLLQLILEDIRGNWAYSQGSRIQSALKLATDLRDKFKVNGMDKMVTLIQDYDYEDGRYFRGDYPYGYYNMEKLHHLSKKFSDKSEEFKTIAMENLTYPEYRFEDWKER